MLSRNHGAATSSVSRPDLRVVAPQEVAEAIAEAVAVRLEVLGDERPPAELDSDERIERRELPQAAGSVLSASESTWASLLSSLAPAGEKRSRKR